MKSIFLILMLAILSCNEIKKTAHLHNDLFFDNLAGEVKTVEESSYTINNTRQISTIDSCCTTLTEYDDKGYRIRQVNKDNSGNEKNGQLYVSRYKNGKPKEIRFTENGKLTSILSAILDKTGKYGDTRIYDSLGKLVFYYSGIKVNEYGKIILMKKITLDRILQQTIVNNYNKQIWIGGYIEDTNCKKAYSTTILLNEKMDPIEATQTTMIDSLTTTTTTRFAYTIYDEHDNWIEGNEIDEKENKLKILKRKITYKNK